MSGTSVGIDLGASTVHVVVLDGASRDRPRVAAARTFAATDLEGVRAITRDAQDVAIDAPAELSRAVHHADVTISPKFRVARCGEIALGQHARIWVPWVTPGDPARVPGWMQVGFAVWAAVRDDGPEPIEVYPAGVFKVLGGVVPPRKTSYAGVHARIALLEPHVELPAEVEVWSHDGIDALGAALVAHQKASGRAHAVGHDDPGCDGSAIWLPAAPDPG